MSEVQALVPAGWVDSCPWATLLGLHSRAEWSWDVHFWFWSPQHHFYWPMHCPVPYLLRPCWKPGHKPPLHYPGCRWQACDDESSMVCWDPALITAVIYWQLLYPLTTAITSWVIMVHRAGNSSVCYLDIDVDSLQSWVNLLWEQPTFPHLIFFLWRPETFIGRLLYSFNRIQ